MELGDPQKHFDGDGAEDFGTLRDLCLHEENMCPYSILGYVQIQRDFQTSNPPYWRESERGKEGEKERERSMKSYRLGTTLFCKL